MLQIRYKMFVTSLQFVILGCLLRLQGVRSGNLALRQPTHQMSTWDSDSQVQYSVDGSSSGNWLHRTCSSTAWNTDPWWRVDLGKSYLVNEVFILNRADCCQERLQGFEIRIGDSLESDGNSNPKCGGLYSMTATDKKSFYCNPGMRGRFVNIRIPGASKMLTLCEVIVNPNPTENIALGKNTLQSSQWETGYPGRAVDGNSDGAWDHSTCTHTQSETNPWWRVDLGTSKPVSEVFIVNRVGVRDRLSNVEVRVGDSLGNNGNDNPQCEETFSMATENKKSIYCKPRKSGRYVNIRQPGEHFLTLCEVSVYSESKAFLRDKPVEATSVQMYAKAPLNLTCPEAFGFPVPHVTWMFNGAVLQNSTTELTLHLNSPPADQDHNIECVATNKHGADYHQFQLQIKSHLAMCASFQDFADDTREIRYYVGDPSTAINDSPMNETQWIRFVESFSGSPRQLPESCVPPWSCGTRAPGWLQGKHPSEEDNVVERTVCFSWNGDCCSYRTKVLVRKCYGHYVYKLKATEFPVKARYCTAPSTLSTDNVMFTSQKKGYALEGHVIHKEANVRGASNCAVYCLADGQCVSFNYCPRENACQLNNATKLLDPQNFTQQKGCEYYELIDEQFLTLI